MNRSQHHDDIFTPLQIKPDVAGVCVLNIEQLDLNVAVSDGLVWSYNIIPQPGLTLIGDTPNYHPNIAGKVDMNGTFLKRVVGTSSGPPRLTVLLLSCAHFYAFRCNCQCIDARGAIPGALSIVHQCPEWRADLHINVSVP